MREAIASLHLHEGLTVRVRGELEPGDCGYEDVWSTYALP
jgi:hypothetical protein